MEFLTKLEEYQKEAGSDNIVFKTLNRLPNIQFKFNVEKNNEFTRIRPEDNFFKQPEIMYVYSSKNTKTIKAISKLVDTKSKQFLNDTHNGRLNENWLKTIITEKIVGSSWTSQVIPYYTDIIYFPAPWGIESMKPVAEYVSMVKYGKLIKTTYVPVDLYTNNKFSNKKALEFLNFEFPIKSYYAAMFPALVYPANNNHLYKNVLLQLLSLKKGLIVGGNLRLTVDALTPKINDFIILFMRFFNNVIVMRNNVLFGLNGIKFICEDFKGIPDEAYNKFVDELLKNEEYDIETIFKTEHKILDIENMKNSLDSKIKDLIQYCQEHPEIKQDPIFKKAQAERTAEAITKNFK